MKPRSSFPCSKNTITGHKPRISLIQSASSQHVCLRSFHLALGLENGFPPTFQTKILYEFLISPMHPTYLVCLILLDNYHPIWWKIHIMKLIITQVFLYPCCSLSFRTKYSPWNSLLKHLQSFIVGLQYIKQGK